MRDFHFVRHEDIPDWLRLGWIARPILNGTHHGVYSEMLEWLCDCPAKVPQVSRETNPAEELAVLDFEMRAG